LEKENPNTHPGDVKNLVYFCFYSVTIHAAAFMRLIAGLCEQLSPYVKAHSDSTMFMNKS
jgi:hypothetical protein